MENATVEETTNLEAETQKRISERIQEVLEAEGYALQPFIQYSEFGLVPRVRLVAIKQKDNDGQTDNPADSGETKAEDTDTPVEPAQDA